MDKKRVWALYRVSTDRQGGEGEKDIPMQEIACRQFAEKKGWTITREIAEKISGYRTPIKERESITEIVAGANNGEFDILLVYHSDRIGRQVEYSIFIATLYTKGIEVWSTIEGELRNEAHEDSLINYIRFWTSEGESRKTSKKVRDSMRQLNEQGEYVGGKMPYGYKLVDTGKKRNSKSLKTIKVQKIDKEEAKVVEMIFDLIVDKYYGTSRIAKYLNELGYTNRGKIWRHNTINRMLRNPIYMGYKRYNAYRRKTGTALQVLPKDEWELQPFNQDLQIVSEETFYKAQDIMDKRNVKKSKIPTASNVLLSGLVTCGYCGGNLHVSFKTNKYTRKDGTVKKTRWYRYECANMRHLPKTNNNHEQWQFGSKTIDRYVEEVVMDTIGSLKLEAFSQEKDLFDIMELDSRKDQLISLEKELNQIDTAYNNAVKLFDDVMMGKTNIDLSFVQERLDNYGEERIKISEKIFSLKKELEKTKVNSDDLEKLKQHLDTWVDSYKELATLEEKKAMLGQVLREVIVKKDEIVIKFNIAIENALMESVDGALENAEKTTNNAETNNEGLVVGNDSNTKRYWNIFSPLNESNDKRIDYTDLIKQWNKYKSIVFERVIKRVG